MSPIDPLLAPLRDVVGAAHVLVEPDVRASYETDWTGRFHGAARMVVRPANAIEARAVVTICAATHTPLVPQGGNTGLVGGSVPRGGEIVLSLRRLDQISIDADRGEAIVGAGAVLESVQTAAGAEGWELGVDLAARESATIGGMVATNAGGERVLRHGPMAEQIIGVEAVLGDGTRVGRVPALRKDNAGYHWAGILAGSEGTLAVITAVHLRLIPKLSDRVVALIALDDIDGALALSGRLRRALPELVALEVCFTDGITLVTAHTDLPQPFDPPAPVVLLAEVTGRAGETDALLARLGELLDAATEVRGTAVATDAASCARLWRYREAHAEAINAIGIPHKLDVSIPFDRMREFVPAVRVRVAEVAPDATTVLFGHIGDGNLHVNVLGPSPDDPAVDDAILDLVIELKGSISAEHGIGIAKRDALTRALPAAELAAERALQRACDPAGILNPGVLFADGPTGSG